MKKALFSLLFITLLIPVYAQDIVVNENPPSQDYKIKWEDSYDKAEKLAKEKQKPLLIYFTGSDWCAPCVNLHKDVLDTKTFFELAASEFIFYEADIPRRTDIISPEKRAFNKELKKRLDVKGTPTILILRDNEIEISRRSGYIMREPDLYFDFIKSAINLY